MTGASRPKGVPVARQRTQITASLTTENANAGRLANTQHCAAAGLRRVPSCERVQRAISAEANAEL